MKIKKLILKNYKVFDHLELDFTDKNGQVLDTIVLAGLNGTGKTTILELLTDLMNGEFNHKILQENTQITLEILVPISYNAFYSIDEKLEKKSDLSISDFSVDEKLIKLHLVFERHGRPINEHNEDVMFMQILRVSRQFAHDTEYEGVFICSFDKKPTNKSNFNIHRAWLNTDKYSVNNEVLIAIQKQVFANPDLPPRQVYQEQLGNLNSIFSDLSITSKLVSINDKDLIFKSINNRLIAFDDLSSGEKTLYFMGFMLKNLDINNGVIMVDQPEDSLHPKWQQQITKFFQNVGENNQVILATHSPQIIASVHPESVFVLGVNKETGKIEVINMEKEHKYSFGVEPNRILDEIMGVPARNEAHEAQIKNILQMIKEVKFNLSKATIEDVEQAITILEQDYGKQDLTIMRFQNEVWLLKRKVAVAK